MYRTSSMGGVEDTGISSQVSCSSRFEIELCYLSVRPLLMCSIGIKMIETTGAKIESSRHLRIMKQAHRRKTFGLFR